MKNVYFNFGKCLSRRAVLIDLNPDYLDQIEKRNAQAPLGLGAA